MRRDTLIKIVTGVTAVMVLTASVAFASGNAQTGTGKRQRQDNKTMMQSMTKEERIAKMKENLVEKVSAGKITQEQADEMIAKMESGEFRGGPGMGRQGKGGPENDGLTAEERLAKCKERLAEEVAAGKITQEQANEMIAKIESGEFRGGPGMGRQGKGGPENDGLTAEERLAKCKERLAEEVAAGKITQEQADEMIAKIESGEFKGGMGMGRPNDGLTKEERLAKLKTELDAKVAAGELTQEKADEIYARAQEGKMQGGPKGGRGRGGRPAASTTETTV